MQIAPLPRAVVLLGLSGIVPQAALLLMQLLDPQLRWVTLAAACFYAAVILSFLGGLWWMQALMRGERDAAPYALAVIPSLVGWAALLPWCLGWSWPGPSLVLLGVALLASPLADRWLARAAPVQDGWMALRLMMATGLGSVTLAMGLLAP